MPLGEKFFPCDVVVGWGGLPDGKALLLRHEHRVSFGMPKASYNEALEGNHQTSVVGIVTYVI